MSVLTDDEYYLLKDAIKSLPEVRLDTRYKRRGLANETPCIAFIFNQDPARRTMSTVSQIYARLVEYVQCHHDGIMLIVNLMKDARINNFGGGTIIFFPSYNVKEN